MDCVHFLKFFAHRFLPYFTYAGYSCFRIASFSFYLERHIYLCTVNLSLFLFAVYGKNRENRIERWDGMGKDLLKINMWCVSEQCL